MTLSRVKWGAVIIISLVLMTVGLGAILRLQFLSNSLLTQQNRQAGAGKNLS
ncbi:UNVERIFIED_ORG: hypothetical protein C7429_103171 [Pantoea allii]|nr:Uncharacterised protein [Pantoea agglomerans]